MAKKYSKVNPFNQVANLLQEEAQWRRIDHWNEVLSIQSKEYWLKDCYRPSCFEIIDYRPLQAAVPRKNKNWHRCQHWEFRFDPILQNALMKIEDFQVTENYYDDHFPQSPVVVINLKNASNRTIFKLHYPQCGL